MGRVVEVAPDPSRCTIVSLVALLQLYATVVLVARSSAPGISQAQKLVPSMSRLRPKWKDWLELKLTFEAGSRQRGADDVTAGLVRRILGTRARTVPGQEVGSTGRSSSA